FATIISYILVFIIREFVGREAVSAILFPVDINFPYLLKLCGLVILVLGFVLIIWANYTLLVIGKIGFTAREPFHVPHSLVVEGPYVFSRNPIYMAVIFLSIGTGILLDSLTFFLLSIVLFFIFWKFFVSWEEKKLEEAFGEQYLEYKKRVRRWL
ncbi:MAG: isoprenylcysteine carboxylmethyltransferase family protein, partial [Candidatus Heimdallarchaeota archaeon]|nr:isoprenylcysteine carboxylmethyltransferase family protein [Candidatus Heimdallarchaeota archaeon]